MNRKLDDYAVNASYKIEERRLSLARNFELWLLSKLGSIGEVLIRMLSHKNFSVVALLLICLLSIFIRSTRDVGFESALLLDEAQKFWRNEIADLSDLNRAMLLINFVVLRLANWLEIKALFVANFAINIVGLLAILVARRVLRQSVFVKDLLLQNVVLFGFAVAFFLRPLLLQFNEFAIADSYFLALFFVYLVNHFALENGAKWRHQFATVILSIAIIWLDWRYVVFVAVFEIVALFFALNKTDSSSLRREIVVRFLLRNSAVFLLIIFAAFGLKILSPITFSSLLELDAENYAARIFSFVRDDVFLIFVALLLMFLALPNRSEVRNLSPFFAAFLAIISLATLAPANSDYLDSSLFYSISLPLFLALFLLCCRENLLAFESNFLLLILLVFLPQFDRTFFVLVLDLCCFWWLIVLLYRRFWREASPGLLSQIFLPHDFNSWLYFGILSAFSLNLAINYPEEMAWIFGAVMSLLMLLFYQKIQHKVLLKQKLPISSVALISLALALFITLHLEATFAFSSAKTSHFLSPNSVTDAIAKTLKQRAKLSDNFLIVTSNKHLAYPLISYVKEQQGEMILLETNDTENAKKFITALKQHQPKIIFFVRNLLSEKSLCEISSTELMLRQQGFVTEFKKYKFDNFARLKTSIKQEPQFFADEILLPTNTEIVNFEVEVYVRK